MDQFHTGRVDHFQSGGSRLEGAPLEHPLFALDYLCVADLATWCMRRALYIPPSATHGVPGHSAEQVREGFAMTSFMEMNQPQEPISPLAVFIAELWGRLSNIDSTLQPLADNFRLTGTLGAGRGFQRWWDLSAVYTPDVRRQLPSRAGTTKDWAFSLFD